MPSRLTPCGLLEVDAASVIVDANPTLLEWIGAVRADVVGQSLETVLAIRLHLVKDGGIPADATLRHRSGAALPVVVGKLPSSDPDAPDRVVVFDLSPDSEFGRAFRAGGSRTERGLKRLQILLGAAVGFAEVRTVEHAAELLVDVARRAFAATSVSVHLREGAHVEQVAGENPLAAHWPPGYKPTGATTLEWNQVLVVPNAAAASQFLPDVPMDEVFRAAGVHAAVASPLRYAGESIGSVICYFDHPRDFDDEAVPLAEALANQAAQAIARVRLEETLRRAAMHDEVTGLPGRRLVEEEVGRTLVAGPGRLCVAFVDLDGFKAVNDRLGHAAGDALLGEVGRRLQSTVREHDIIGRFGGDEFIAVAQVEHEEDAVALGERIRRSVAQPYPGIPLDLPVTASVGLVSAVEPGDAGFVFDQLVRAADHAMYEAKTAGGDRVSVGRFSS